MRKKLTIVWALSMLTLTVQFSIINIQAPAGRSARAATAGIARVLNDGVLLYRSASGSSASAVVELTKTYYIKVTDTGYPGEFYPVEYQADNSNYIPIFGFVKKSEVTLWTAAYTQPLNPEFTATTTGSIGLREDPNASSPIKEVFFSGVTLYCYGVVRNAEEGNYYALVKTNISGRIGYVYADSMTINFPSAHTDPLPKPPVNDEPGEDGPGDNPPDNSGGDNTPPAGGGCLSFTDDYLQIILIIAICVPALLIVFLLFRPAERGRGRRFRNYYEDE